MEIILGLLLVITLMLVILIGIATLIYKVAWLLTLVFAAMLIWSIIRRNADMFLLSAISIIALIVVRAIAFYPYWMGTNIWR